MQNANTPAAAAERKTGVHTYVAQWPIFAVAWSARQARLALGSYLEDSANAVELLHFDPDTSAFSGGGLRFDHPHPPTNLMFDPTGSPGRPDLLATSGDFLRLWEIHGGGGEDERVAERVELRALLNGNKGSEFSAAITSFDWSHVDARKVATCSVDTTCTVWDVERESVEAQLVAHDKQVYDISWGGVDVFASVSGDGSVRVFDLRDKERSTIIYENPAQGCPLLRVEWNKFDPRYIATVGMDSQKVVILDIRLPTTPLVELCKHRASVNAISWSPAIGRRLCSVGDDYRALIWDVVGPAGGVGDVEPEMWYESTAEINQVRWSPLELEWIAISFSNKLQLLKV